MADIPKMPRQALEPHGSGQRGVCAITRQPLRGETCWKVEPPADFKPALRASPTLSSDGLFKVRVINKCLSGAVALPSLWSDMQRLISAGPNLWPGGSHRFLGGKRAGPWLPANYWEFCWAQSLARYRVVKTHMQIQRQKRSILETTQRIYHLRGK